MLVTRKDLIIYLFPISLGAVNIAAKEAVKANAALAVNLISNGPPTLVSETDAPISSKLVPSLLNSQTSLVSLYLIAGFGESALFANIFLLPLVPSPTYKSFSDVLTIPKLI